MKIRWISNIVLILTFFAVQGVGYGEDGQTCQPDVVVMFGNGVWNDADDTDESRYLLQIRLEKHIYGTDLEGKISYDTAHNPSEGGFADLLEAFEQNIQTNYSQFWRFLAGLDLMPDILQDKLKEIATQINADIVSTNPSVQEHIAVYDQYLSEGNVVVLVAHSQGNLYGNIAHLGLDQQYIDRFGIVSVANPDSYIAGGGPYTTIEEDYIISPLQFVYPFALPPNLDNFTGPVNLADWSGHRFIESYMAAGHAAETVILDNVVNMINELSQPFCCVDFTADVVSGSSPLTVQFTNLTSAACDFDKWLWDFGDKQFSYEQAPIHIYRDTGIFTVSLKAWKHLGAGNMGTAKIYQKAGTSGPTNEIAHQRFTNAAWILVGGTLQNLYKLFTENPAIFIGGGFRYSARRVEYANINLEFIDPTRFVFTTEVQYYVQGSLHLESGCASFVAGIEQGRSYREDATSGILIPLGDLSAKIGTPAFDVSFEDIDYSILTDFPFPATTGWQTEPIWTVRVRKFQTSVAGIAEKTKTNYITVP